MIKGIKPKFECARLAYEIGEQEFDWSNPNVCFGKGSSGSNTTTTTEEPPPQVLQAYTTATNAAQQAASQPLQQYSGSTVAGFTPDQTSAMGTINNLQGTAQPYIDQATGLINNSTANLWNGVQQFSPDAISQYQNPYTQQVVGSTEAQLNNMDQQQQQQLKGNAISSGAFGGDRAGVASAVLSGQQDLANNQTIAGLESQGYGQAEQEFNTQQQAQLGANEANQYLDAQGAYGLGNLGNEALSTGLTGASAQLQSGALQQQLGQEALNVPYEQYEQQQAYPFQTAQYFANIAEGLGSGQGGTSSTTSPAASSSSQLGGLGLSGIGALGSIFGGGGSKRGGAIHRADGGGVPDLSVSFIPTTQSVRGSGLPSPPKSSSSQQPSGADDVKNGAALGKGLGILGSLFSSGSSSGINGGSSALDTSGSSAVDVGGESNALDIFSSGSFGDGAGEGASSLSDIFDFAKGGMVPPHMRGKRFAIGGEVLPDVISGIGDIVGAFFGDPGAGDQGVGLLSAVDGGRTGGEGVEGRAMGSIFGKDNSEGGFTRGGMPHHYDGGGNVGGLSPLAASTSVQTPGQQTQSSTYQGMTPEQLQMVLMRLPPGSQQAQSAAAVLQQKRMMPNVGQKTQGGFSGQSQTPLYGGMARGGLAFDDGGDIPDPPSQSDLETQLSQLGQGSGLSAPSMAPSTAAPSMPSSDTSAVSAPEAKSGTRKADPWQSLMAAGFGMMAGQSPNALTNVGQGALAGLKNYREQQDEADKANTQTGDLGAKNRQLTQEGQYQTGELGIKKEEAKAQAEKLALMAQQIQQGKFITVKDAYGNDRLFNTKIQQFMDVPTSQASPFSGATPAASSATPTGTPTASGSIPPPPPSTTITDVGGQAVPSSSAPQNNSPANDASGNADALPSDYQARLAKYPPQRQWLIKEVIEGRIPPDRSHFGNGFQQLQNDVAYVDPTFDLANPTARMKTAADYSSAGKSGQTITSLNTASKHAVQLALSSLDLNNNSGIGTLLNRPENYLESAMGDPRLNNYNSVLDVYAPEATKVVSGKSNFAEGELDSIKNNFPSSGSPEQILGALSNTNGLMLSRAEELQNTHDKNMGPVGQHKQVVSPEAKSAFADLDGLYRHAKSGTLDSPEAQATIGRLKQYIAVPGTQQGGAQSQIPATAIAHLKANPALAQQFEQKYGVPASQYLGGQ